MCLLNFCDKLWKQLKGGRYFPITAVQRFDAAVSFLLHFLIMLLYLAKRKQKE